ncbi:MAG: hypothetical protein V3V45_03225, partial [Candidatus Brocadiales bacterium]
TRERTRQELFPRYGGGVQKRPSDAPNTAGSWMRMEGADLADIKEVLGHSRMEMTLRYAHLGPSHKKRAVQKLDKILGHTKVEH